MAKVHITNIRVRQHHTGNTYAHQGDCVLVAMEALGRGSTEGISRPDLRYEKLREIHDRWMCLGPGVIQMHATRGSSFVRILDSERPQCVITIIPFNKGRNGKLKRRNASNSSKAEHIGVPTLGLVATLTLNSGIAISSGY